jgi:hypothetical protein
MIFARHLRDRVRSGEITCSLRIWHRPRVRTGGCYRMDEGRIEVTAVRLVAWEEVTDALAVRSGFADAGDLLATARHGSGDNPYLVEFRYLGPDVQTRSGH